MRKILNILKHPFCSFIILPTLLLSVVLLLSNFTEIKIEDCINERIVVEEKQSKNNTRSSDDDYYVLSENIVYDISNLNVCAPLLGKSANKIYSEIEIGEIIDILYVKKSGVFGDRYSVVDARSADSVYIDLDLYNTEKNMRYEKNSRIWIIISTIIELVCIFYFFVILIYNRKTNGKRIITRGWIIFYKFCVIAGLVALGAMIASPFASYFIPIGVLEQMIYWIIFIMVFLGTHAFLMPFVFDCSPVFGKHKRKKKH